MKRMMMLCVALFILAVSPAQADDGGLQSLRQQGLNTQDPAEKLKNFPKDNEHVGLSYVQQPPLIPHSIRNYQVDKKTNKCLSCHSFKNYKKYDATKISTTHFTDRDGKVLSDVSPRRYFCLQCHVPQVESEALIKNDFQPAGALKN